MPNGPRIGDSGGLESQNFQYCTKLNNSHLLFSKFKKKVNIIGFLRNRKPNLQILALTRDCANTMLPAVLINSYLSNTV